MKPTDAEVAKPFIDAAKQLQAKGIKVIERDFTSETDYIRHDPRKLARTVEDFASGWIK